MKPATLVSLGCLVAICWIGSVSKADACTCVPPETLAARDQSVAVFEGTVVDRRVGLLSQGPFWLPVPEQEIVVRRVWKGVSTERVSVLYLNGGMCTSALPVGMTALFFMKQQYGRIAYGGCLPNQRIADATQALATLGPPIATFADRPPPVLTVPATLPLSHRLRAFVKLSAAYYLNARILVFHPPLPEPFQWSYGLLLCVLLLQFIYAIIFVTRRLLRRSLLLFSTSAMTGVVLLLWTGYDLASRPGMSELMRWP